MSGADNAEWHTARLHFGRSISLIFSWCADYVVEIEPAGTEASERVRRPKEIKNYPIGEDWFEFAGQDHGGSCGLNNSVDLDLLKNEPALPSLDILKDDQSAQVAVDCVNQPFNGFQLSQTLPVALFSGTKTRLWPCPITCHRVRDAMSRNHVCNLIDDKSAGESTGVASG